MARMEELVVGLDIGTTKICCVVGEVTDEGVDIVGIGTHPAEGLRRGVVVNIQRTVESIRHAVEEAEIMADCEIETVFAGIAGSHIQSFNSNGVVAIKSREVTSKDVERAIGAARTISLPLDRKIVHIIPQEYIVDDQHGIQNPVGMAGVRMEVKAHVVTGAVASAQNVIKCCHKAGLHVADIVLDALASTEAVLTPEEKQLGVALVDFGGGTTDLVIFHESSVRYTSVLGVGGNNLTNDLAVGLRTPMDEAEKIKQRHGCVLSSMIGSGETLEVPSMGGRQSRQLDRSILGDILEPRMEEVLYLLQNEILKSGYADLLASGVVFTGGASLVEGLAELAEQILGQPARVGYPMGVAGLKDIVRSPMYATGVGLVLHARSMERRASSINMFRRALDSMKRWFKDVF